MDWIERLNGTMVYIEEHLTDDIDYEQIAKIACCSSYHYQRMFSYMAGVPLSEYIRRRRMTMAAVELQSGKEKVLDVALKYGYDSPTAFNRAFQKVHGITPSQAKESGIMVKAFPPISFKITIKGEAEMNYRIEKKEAFRIIGVSTPLFKEVEKNFLNVPKFFNETAANGTIQKLAGMMKNEPMGILGVSECNNQEDWKYYVAVANRDDSAEGFEEYVISASTWAIFPGEGVMPASIQELEKRIVTEWLPTSGYEYANSPDIEVYLNEDPKNAKYEVWIPVTPKAAK